MLVKCSSKAPTPPVRQPPQQGHPLFYFALADECCLDPNKVPWCLWPALWPFRTSGTIFNYPSGLKPHTSLPPSLNFIMKIIKLNNCSDLGLNIVLGRGGRGGMQNQGLVRNTKYSPPLTHSTTQVHAIPGTEPATLCMKNSLYHWGTSLAPVKVSLCGEDTECHGHSWSVRVFSRGRE